MTTLPPHDSDASKSNRDRIRGEGFAVLGPDTWRVEIGEVDGKVTIDSKTIAVLRMRLCRGQRQRTVSIGSMDVDPSRERILMFGSAVDSIPSSIANLPNHKCLCDMASLEKLEVSLLRDDLIDSLRFHSSFGKLKNLKHFYCNNTPKLSELPKEIGDITSLEILHLHYTGIKSLPSSIGNLKNLKNLSLCPDEAFSELPEEVGDITGLEILALSHCTMKLLPSSIGKLKNLKKLSLSCCMALLELPEEIGKLHKLTDLDLYFTDKLRELPPSTGQLQNLKTLTLHRAVPPSIANFQNLVTLTMPRDILNTMAGSLTNSEALPSLTTLVFNTGSNVDHPPQWTPLEYEALSIVAKRCKSLGYIYIFFTRFSKKETDDVACVLSRNRARSRFMRLKQVQVAPTLWPYMIHNATNASKPDDTPQLFSSFPNSITRPDAIHQLLTDGIESFVGLLFHRKNAMMPQNDVSKLKG